MRLTIRPVTHLLSLFTLIASRRDSVLETLNKLDLIVREDPSKKDEIAKFFAGEIKSLPEIESGSFDKETMEEMIKLGKLHLFGTRSLKALPNSIGSLANLKKLYLCYSGIESLPETIGNLAQLGKLNLFGTRSLKALPSSIGSLANLKTLNLSYAGIVSLPETIGNLTKLEELYLLGTKSLKALPSSIGSLTNLKKLYFCYSGIESLPETIGDLTKLEKLNLSGTGLKRLPKEIESLAGRCTIFLLKTPSFQDGDDQDGNLGRTSLENRFGAKIEFSPGNTLAGSSAPVAWGDEGTSNLKWNLDVLKTIKVNDTVPDLSRNGTVSTDSLVATIKANLASIESISRETRTVIQNILDESLDYINSKDTNEKYKPAQKALINFIGLLVEMAMCSSGDEKKECLKDANMPALRSFLTKIIGWVANKINPRPRDDPNEAARSLEAICSTITAYETPTIKLCINGRLELFRDQYYAIAGAQSGITDLSSFMNLKIAIIKEQCFDAAIAEKNKHNEHNVNNAHVWRHRMHSNIGLRDTPETQYGIIGTDPFDGDEESCLKAFFDVFTPNFVTSQITDIINNKTDSDHNIDTSSVREMLFREIIDDFENGLISKDSVIEMIGLDPETLMSVGESSQISKSAIEHIMVKMNVLQRQSTD